MVLGNQHVVSAMVILDIPIHVGLFFLAFLTSFQTFFLTSIHFLHQKLSFHPCGVNMLFLTNFFNILFNHPSWFIQEKRKTYNLYK